VLGVALGTSLTHRSPGHVQQTAAANAH
jgi:hypothetical protein